MVTISRRRITIVVLLAGLVFGGAFGWRAYRRRETARWLDEAISAAHRDESARAISLLDAVLRRNPEHPKALVYRAQLARDAGQRDLTLDLLRRVTDDSPREAGTARYVEGTMAIEDNHARKAEALYLKSIELHPTYQQPRTGLAQIYANQWRGPEIRATLDGLRQLRELNIEELIVYTDALAPNRTPEEVIPRLENWVGADPDDLASLVALCRYCLIDDRIAQALRLLQQALAAHAGDERFAALLAEAYLLQSNRHAAAAVLDRFPATDACHSWLWRSHGLASFADGNWARAAACLERALTAEPEDVAVAYKLGQAWERLGRHSAAERRTHRNAGFSTRC
jgi:predicted Zn-dependent protease